MNNTVNSNIGEINSDTMDKIQENTNEEEKILSDNSDIENTKEVPSSSLMYISFIIFITVLYVAKYFLPKFDYILTIIFFIIIIIIQIGVGLSIVSSRCSNPNSVMGNIILTVLPWLVIYALTNIIIENIMPGWKIPFSNTFGYIVIKIMGVKSLTNNIFSESKTPSNIMRLIYSDQSLIVNEITPRNFDNMLKQLFTSKRISKDNELELRKLVNIKDMVGSYMWSLLTGFLAIAINHNYLLGIKCKLTAEDIKKL